MYRLNKKTAQFNLLPGNIDWLEYQKDPDGLINKLVMDYRHKGHDKRFKRFSDTICTLFAGLMLGYAWRMFHGSL